MRVVGFLLSFILAATAWGQPLTSRTAHRLWDVPSGDPADTGVIRLGDTSAICWERTPPGTDVCLSVDDEVFSFDGTDMTFATLANVLSIQGTGTPSSSRSLINLFPTSTSAEASLTLLSDSGSGASGGIMFGDGTNPPGASLRFSPPDDIAVADSLVFNGGEIIEASSDTADSGFLRVPNATTFCWEANPAGTDRCVSVDTSNRFTYNDGLSLHPLYAGPASGVIDTLFVFSPTSVVIPTGVSGYVGMHFNPAVSVNTGSAAITQFLAAPTLTQTVNPTFYTYNGFANSSIATSATNAVAPMQPDSFIDNSIVQQTAGTATASLQSISFLSLMSHRAAGGDLTVGGASSFWSRHDLRGTSTGDLVITTLRGGMVEDPDQTASGGTVDVGTFIGWDFEDFTIGTLRASIRSAMNSGTGKWTLLGTGTAPMFHQGGVRIGDAAPTVPTEKLEVAGNIRAETTGIPNTSMRVTPTATTSALAQSLVGYEYAPALTAQHIIALPIAFQSVGTVVAGTGGSGVIFTGLQVSTALSSATAGVSIPGGVVFNHGATYSGSSGGAHGTTAGINGLQDAPAITLTGSGTTATVTNLNSVASTPDLNVASGATLTIGTRRALFVNNPDVAGVAGTLALGTQVAVDIASLTSATTNLSLRSAGAGTQLRHAGPGVFGANAAMTGASVGLEVQSTTLAFLPSRMTTTQRDALTAVDGMLIYNTTNGRHESREAGVWVDL